MRGSGFGFMVLGGVALVVRVVLVQLGVLFGDQAVSRVDVVVASMFGIGLALLAFDRARRLRNQAADPFDPDPQPAGQNQAPTILNDRLSMVTGIVSVGALVIASINLFAPVQLPSRPRAACPGAQDHTAPYIGITGGENGNNSRQGPAVSFPANGRFPSDCTVGFSHYCIGEPIVDSLGTVKDVQRWLTSRWLVVSKQPNGWRSALAQTLSDENPEPQYVTDANITPATSYERLTYGGDGACAGEYQLPERATLTDLDPSTQVLGAQADHAVNMGFAVWIPPGDTFIDDDSYHQIYDPAGTERTNPGATQPDGSKKVVWNYTGTLANRRDTAEDPGVVVVMAIPCLADNIPADLDNAAFSNYDITSAETPQKVDYSPAGVDRARLARAACQANT